MNLVERAAVSTDEYLGKYILKAVTEGHSYTKMHMTYEVACGKDMRYDRYRKFYWLLDKMKGV